MLTSITRELGFDMGHRVPNHSSKCQNVHGHRYRIFVTLKGETMAITGDSSEGMVVDFTDLKTIANSFIDTYLDHGYMGHESLDKQMLETLESMESKHIRVKFIPTAENIAAWLFLNLEKDFKLAYGDKNGFNFWLEEIVLYETPNNFVRATTESVQGWTPEVREALFYDKGQRVAEVIGY